MSTDNNKTDTININGINYRKASKGDESDSSIKINGETWEPLTVQEEVALDPATKVELYSRLWSKEKDWHTVKIDIFPYLKEELGEDVAAEFIGGLKQIDMSGKNWRTIFIVSSSDKIRDQLDDFERLFNAVFVNQRQLDAFTRSARDILCGKGSARSFFL